MSKIIHAAAVAVGYAIGGPVTAGFGLATSLVAQRGGGKESPRVGYGLFDSASGIKGDILAKLRSYMNGFMNDPSLNGRPGYPRTRASWPGIDGRPTDAWGSPLAHRAFFDWQAGASAGRRDGQPCLDEGALSNLLYAIGADQKVAGNSTASIIINDMFAGTCLTWDDWFHFIFGRGAIDNSAISERRKLGGVPDKVLRIPASILASTRAAPIPPKVKAPIVPRVAANAMVRGDGPSGHRDSRGNPGYR